MSHVRLYPRIIVSNSHGNALKYVDTMTIFQKLYQKVSDPKMTFDPTSVEVTCVTTQGSFYPSPMKMHQSMWIQWLFVKNFDQKVNDPNDP